MREAADFVDAHRVALLGDEQPALGGVEGQPLEALVATQADAEGQLLAIGGVNEGGLLVDVDADQPLLPLVADDVATRADVLDRLRIAEAGQGNLAQQATVQGQLDDLWRLVGDAEQAVPVGVVGQRRDIVVQPLDLFPLDHHAVVRQPDGALAPAFRVTPLAHGEPAPLVDPELLAEPGQRRQHDQQDYQQQAKERQARHGRLERENGF
ncbi:hypothetical protein D3C80_1185440 [compost metagenome]